MRFFPRAASCAAALVILGVAPLAAQTDFRNLDEGRPTHTEDALPVDHYGFELVLPYALEAEGETRLHLTTPELMYGLRRGGEVGLALPLAALDEVGGTTWALAGARLFALQNLLREGPSAPALARSLPSGLKVTALTGPP